jgi:hypothetical protein
MRSVVLFALATSFCGIGSAESVSAAIDSVTRFVKVSYVVPKEVPDEVTVNCAWSKPGANGWKAANVTPDISETGKALVPVSEWKAWATEGKIVERRAAGLVRTVIFNPYPDAQVDGKVDVDFRIQVQGGDGKSLAEYVTRVQADNSDVVYVEDWSNCLTKSEIVTEGESSPGKWRWKSGIDLSEGVSFGNALYGDATNDAPLKPLAYALDLSGNYAIFVLTSYTKGPINLRLSGDERSDTVGTRLPRDEVLWRWAKMDRQNLVLSGPHQYTGYIPAHVDYVKLVPLPDDVYAKLTAIYTMPQDKLVAGYFEPYSWAFFDNIVSNLQHREPLRAFADARVPWVDIQIGRFGMKVVYESRKTDLLLYSTIGDPIGDIAVPKTENVGRMQQYTNTLETELRYSKELGLRAFANFGASNCYPGTPLQGDFSAKHPEWMRGSALRFEVPEVRAYALSLYREALELGAPGVSIDFCRYPETIDTAETCTGFLRELRELADEFSKARGERVPVLVRFPGTGVRLAEFFDYATWANEGLVDYLCPSNIQGRHMHIEMAPYFEAVKGTKCTLLPCLDALSWALPFPGPYYWRLKQIYDQGAPGVYVYQADGRVLGRPEDRRAMMLLGSTAAIDAWWKEDDAKRPLRSKAIYITPPHEFGKYHGYERIRIWVDGVPMGALEAYIDDTLVTKVDGPPYLVGTEEYESDGVVPKGEHVLRVRVKDGDGWLEERFVINGG